MSQKAESLDLMLLMKKAGGAFLARRFDFYLNPGVIAAWNSWAIPAEHGIPKNTKETLINDLLGDST